MRTLRKPAPVNAGSMADIAFLLLIFFFVTTTIENEKGITLMLPAWMENSPPQKMKERNLFKVLINSENRLLAEGEILMEVTQLKDMVIQFVMNPAHLDHLSESPAKAVISLKVDRGSQYSTYIEVLDQLKGAYYEIYGSRVNLSAGQFRALDLRNPREKTIYQRARDGIPMNISLAEPMDSYERDY